MPKVQAQAGASLADSYDVVGSIIGVEQLTTQDVSLTHEMGGTMFSERLISFQVNLTSGDIAASTAFNATGVQPLPDVPVRILGITCIVDTASRLANLMVGIRDPVAGGDLPFFIWDNTLGTQTAFRFSDSGASVGATTQLSGAELQTPNLVTRFGLSRTMPELVMRGITTGFGAGTLETQAFIHIAHPSREVPAPGEPSSHGLPLPGW